MARKKNKKSRKQGLFSKAVNAGLVILTLARPIQLLLRFGFGDTFIAAISSEATFGLLSSTGKFSLAEGAKMYGPGIAAFGIGKLKSFALRHYPVR